MTNNHFLFTICLYALKCRLVCGPLQHYLKEKLVLCYNLRATDQVNMRGKFYIFAPIQNYLYNEIVIYWIYKDLRN